MKKYAESKGFFDFKAERELYSIAVYKMTMVKERIIFHC